MVKIRINKLVYVSILVLTFSFNSFAKIDRYALVMRNNPHVTKIDSLSSLSVGNGNFAYTVDATGLQTFPELYSNGVPLGTQSQWGWHSFVNVNHYKFSETLRKYNFRGWDEWYSVQYKTPERNREAGEWFRGNPHRLHLGIVGLELTNPDGSRVKSSEIQDIDQTLDLWDGIIKSNFQLDGEPVQVHTACSPDYDQIAATVHSPLIAAGGLKVNFRFPYPTGKHTDDGCNFSVPDKHTTEIISSGAHSVVFRRTLDSTVYYVTVCWTGKATMTQKEKHYYVLAPSDNNFSFTCEFTDKAPATATDTPEQAMRASSTYWQNYWNKGGVVDFSECTAPRAKELERRVVLSQYLLAIQDAGMYPPQETGLTYNSWFGKFHMEMIWWHQASFPLWGHADLLERSLGWYAQVESVAKDIAQRQGFKGVRWMKMTDPSGTEAPSNVGSFLIWQQPHIIYLADLVYRSNPSPEILKKYGDLVEETAEFMASFATYDKAKNRYILKGAIPAQETLRASETINSPFELSYWHFALSVAQKWRILEGKKRNPAWDKVINKLSPLAYNKDGLYLASEDAVNTYKDIRFTSDHPAVLALGIFPMSRLIKKDIMKNTLSWIWDNWNWDETWGWDYPMVAMDAARLGEPQKAVDALLMDKRTNTYLVNGHNYQDDRLRVYLPGNGGLLTAVGMMCAGWDGNKVKNPGFPKDGKWNVQWEGLLPMP